MNLEQWYFAKNNRIISKLCLTIHRLAKRKHRKLLYREFVGFQKETTNYMMERRCYYTPCPRAKKILQITVIRFIEAKEE